MKNFDELKVGDVVVRHIPNDKRTKPMECLISKVGRQYVYVWAGYNEIKYNKENGYGEYGWEIFPGTLIEFNRYNEENEFFMKLRREMEKYNNSCICNRKHLTKNQIERIYEILNEE